MPDLINCLCGATPIVLPTSPHRQAARDNAAEYLIVMQAAPPVRGSDVRVHERQKLAGQMLRPDHVEVVCPTCGRWVHAETEDAACTLWNKAIEKIHILQACCETDYERRVDYDGMVLHVCTSASHDDTVHGRRYLPLEPSDGYTVTPRDAEG